MSNYARILIGSKRLILLGDRRIDGVIIHGVCFVSDSMSPQLIAPHCHWPEAMKDTKDAFLLGLQIRNIFVPSARRAQGTMLSCVRVCP